MFFYESIIEIENLLLKTDLFICITYIPTYSILNHTWFTTHKKKHANINLQKKKNNVV